MTATVTSLWRTTAGNRVANAASIGCLAIVDDDESVRRALARLLGTYGFDVRTYRSASEFLDSLNSGMPACLIVDLQMDGMTGLELLHRLTDMGLRIPAIVVTARDEPGIRDGCESAGAIAFLVKPVMRDPLLEAIEAAAIAGLDRAAALAQG